MADNTSVPTVADSSVTSNPKITNTLPTSSTMSSFDHYNLQITQHKLNGSNFREWFQSVLLVIKGKGKAGYLTGSVPVPSVDATDYNTWEAENSIVMAWLINSMEPKIGRTYLFYKTAKEIWDAVQAIYSDMENTAQCFEVRSAIRNARQNNMDVTTYFNKLVELWQEIDLFHDMNWECPNDAVKYSNMLEKDRVFDFLQGLNADLDEVRGRLLGTKPFPSLRDAFAEVRREESRKRVMLNSFSDSSSNSAAQNSSFATFKHEVNKPSPRDQIPPDKQWCDHCNKPFHTRESCWKIHGKPANWKPRNKREFNRNAYIVEAAQETSKATGINLSTEQVELLHQLLNQTKLQKGIEVSTSSRPTASVAQQGNLGHSLVSRRLTQKYWIVDTGATDHMTGTQDSMTDFQASDGSMQVTVADGATALIMGQGSICLPNFKLKSVLYVQGLECNFISVSKITRDLDCIVTFFPTHCIFQDRSSGRMIGNAEEKDGLYYITGGNSISQLAMEMKELWIVIVSGMRSFFSLSFLILAFMGSI